jgi:hypothetical protein
MTDTQKPQNDTEAFVLAVQLMQTAPSEEKHAEAKELVKHFAAQMTDAEFDAAMKLVS